MRGRFNRRITLIMGLVALLVAVGVMTASAGKVVYYYNWYGNDSQESTFQTLMERFRAEHPEIEVELIRGGTVSGSSPTDRLISMIAAGTSPDIVHFERSIGSEFAARGLLHPLDGELASMVETEYVPGAAQELLYRGKVYGVPYGTDIRGLFWNAADFAEAGLDPERGPATIEELDQFAAQLSRTDGDGKYSKIGFVPWYGNWYAVGWLYTFGGDIYDAENVAPRVNTPNHIRGFEWIQEYGELYPYDVVGASVSGKSQNDFYGRTLSMMAHWNGQANLIRQADPSLDFNVGEVPHPSYGHNGTWLGGQAHVIPATAKNKEDALTLLRWLSTGDAEIELYRNVGSLPTRWSALAEISDELTPTDAILVQQTDVGWGRPPLWFPQFYNHTRDAMIKVARGETSAKEALDEAQRLLELDFEEILGQ